jgi:hypothetical protein
MERKLTGFLPPSQGKELAGNADSFRDFRETLKALFSIIFGIKVNIHLNIMYKKL